MDSVPLYQDIVQGDFNLAVNDETSESIALRGIFLQVYSDKDITVMD